MKLLVNIHVPVLDSRYDVLVPEDLRIRMIVSLVAKTVETLSNGRYISSGEERLCSVEKNIRFRSNATLKQYGIQNGDHLVLI